MFLLFKSEEFKRKPDVCPRCGTQISSESKNVISCWRCDLDFRSWKPDYTYYSQHLRVSQSDFDFFSKVMTVGQRCLMGTHGASIFFPREPESQAALSSSY
ncbi:hypothetical protein SCHPADRAFT_622546 [Schizopora paradoxa]|uniref:Uncharacterized protein n=1 Tax=Schizopora paradoxa TaxID=27342 RepID=A0A0H2R8B3_9AGAM|nr:hypothetical protein SCHPADRAFT_622546 [Schizopora paradoxa]